MEAKYLATRTLLKPGENSSSLKGLAVPDISEKKALFMVNHRMIKNLLTTRDISFIKMDNQSRNLN